MVRTYTAKRGTRLFFNEDNSLRGENTVADSNPARVLWREAWHDWKNFSLEF
jgi:hypothetical protein